MGDCLFCCGSRCLNCLGFGVRKKKNKAKNKTCKAIPVQDKYTQQNSNEATNGYGKAQTNGVNGVNDFIDQDERVIKNIEEMALYCKPLLFMNFKGQVSGKQTDKNATTEVFNMGMLLRELDGFVRLCPDPTRFTFDDPVACGLLQKIADKRHRDLEKQSDCYRRLMRDAIRFAEIYKERAVNHPKGAYSERLDHDEYWGTRQQLLSCKVICDWLSEDDMPPMDPIFGVLLNPTAGRVGPGDSGWVHNLLYDNVGEWAHHSAVHDAFGYLITFHGVGPGYNYMFRSFLNKDQPLSGQISGIEFWKKYVKEENKKKRTRKTMRLFSGGKTVLQNNFI